MRDRWGTPWFSVPAVQAVLCLYRTLSLLIPTGAEQDTPVGTAVPVGPL